MAGRLTRENLREQSQEILVVLVMKTGLVCTQYACLRWLAQSWYLSGNLSTSKENCACTRETSEP